MGATHHIRDPEIRQAAKVIESSDAVGPYLYTSAATPGTTRWTFRDRVFLSRKELLETAATLVTAGGEVSRREKER